MHDNELVSSPSSIRMKCHGCGSIFETKLERELDCPSCASTHVIEHDTSLHPLGKHRSSSPPRVDDES